MDNFNLTTVDDPKVVTDWYKEKIKSDGFNITSFVQTSTNGRILNQLTGADGDREVSVEISKDAQDEKVAIKLNFKG